MLLLRSSSLKKAKRAGAIGPVLGLAVVSLLFPCLLAGAPGEETLYSSSRDDANLRDLDPSTGKVRQVIPMRAVGYTVLKSNGLAVDPLSGAFYVVVSIAEIGGRSLAVVDPASGSLQLRGGVPSNVAGIAFSADGDLYAITGAGEHSLYRLDKATGQASFVVNTNSHVCGDSLAFHRSDGKLYRLAGCFVPREFQAITLGTWSATSIPLADEGFVQATAITEYKPGLLFMADIVAPAQGVAEPRLFVLPTDGSSLRFIGPLDHNAKGLAYLPGPDPDTSTPTPTVTGTDTGTATHTPTATETATKSSTPTPTSSLTDTPTESPTSSPTATSTESPAPTSTATSTPSSTSTSSATPPTTMTSTATATAKPVQATSTRTATPCPTPRYCDDDDEDRDGHHRRWRRHGRHRHHPHGDCVPRPTPTPTHSRRGRAHGDDDGDHDRDHDRRDHDGEGRGGSFHASSLELRTDGPKAPATRRLPAGLDLVVAPNPARGSATVCVRMPRLGQAHLGLYDLNGSEVRRQALGSLPAGEHCLGLRVDALAPGVYVAVLVGPGDLGPRPLAFFKLAVAP